MARGLCDTHCHLDLEPIRSHLSFVLNSSKSCGVDRFIVPATTRKSWSTIEDLADQYPEIYFAQGLHPAFIDMHAPEDVVCLEEMLKRPHLKCLAVGEIGLDRRYAQEARQEELFRAQLEVAKAYCLPVIIHSVGRHYRVLEILKEVSGVHGVVHAYSGSKEQAMQFVELGFKLGVGSLLLRSRKARDAFQTVPLDSILLETDSPDMYLPSSRSRCGSPLDMLVVLRELCSLRGLDVDFAAEALQQNCEKLFFQRNSSED
jgi:TatD DNase family protein